MRKKIEKTKTIQTQCCIAGGGPAGIILGYLLARAGIEVYVLEKWPDFFRDFRGDTIHPSTMENLADLGLLDDFLKLPHNKTKSISGHIGGEKVKMADFSHLKVRCPFIAFIPQWDFLNFISKKAKKFSNFHLMMETEVLDVIKKKGEVTGIRAKNKKGNIEFKCPLVIGADGRDSIIREKTGLNVNKLGAPIDVLWFRLSRKDNGSHESLGHANKGKVMVMINRSDYWQCGFIINKGAFSKIKAKGLKAFQDEIRDIVPSLSSTAKELKKWDQVKLLSVQVDHLTQWYKKGILCIGDSAHAMSPIGGVGINLAIQDAVAAANILIPAFRKGSPSIHDLKKVQKRREFPTRLIQRLQVFLHRNAIKPALKNRGRITMPLPLKLLNRFSFLQRIPARLIGIGFRSEKVDTDLFK